MPPTFYAHAVIEEPGAGAQRKFAVGDRVPKDLDGFDELVESGSISEEAPEVHVTAGDGGEAGEVAE